MEYVDYAMPLRVMDSDMLSYVHQKKAISKEHMKRRDLKQDEYLSRFSKQDRLLPVITLVLYCGEKPWDGARCLHEMLELSGLPEELKAYVENYSIHILDVCHTPDDRLREFPAELCFLLMCIKYAKDKEAFLRLTERAEASVVSEDTYETIAEYLGEPELLEILNMERSTFYDRKREAILLLGVSLWGYAIPCFKGIFNMKGADESDDIPDFFK